MEKLIVDYNFSLKDNMEVVKDNIIEDIKKYDVIVTDDSVKGAKEFMASINKDKKLFNDTCKEFITKVSDPITKFKTSQKEISDLFDDARLKLKSQVETFDDKKLRVIEQVIIDYRDEVCVAREISPDAIVISDLILLGSVTTKMKPAKKVIDTIEARIQTVENEILKARLEAEEEAKKIREIQENARIDAEEKSRLREELLIKQAEIDKDNALKKQKQELLQPNPQEEVITIPKMPIRSNMKRAVLTFDFEIKGEVPDAKIIERIKSQVNDEFMKYLINTEIF